ncbi:hypothetical protein FQN57_002355 [Myotisia sp. PD_48]|nr:hypothetical protein FQN57_002355 [Myotisia sp. PD_48]
MPKNQNTAAEWEQHKEELKPFPINSRRNLSLYTIPSTPEGILACTPGGGSDMCDSGAQVVNEVTINILTGTGQHLPGLNNLPCIQFRKYLHLLVDQGDSILLGQGNQFVSNDSSAKFFQNEAANLNGSLVSAIDFNPRTKMDLSFVTESSLQEAQALLLYCLRNRECKAFDSDSRENDIIPFFDPVMIQADGDLVRRTEKLFKTSKADALIHFLQLCGYLSSNNLMSDDQTRMLLDWINRNGLRYMLKDMFLSNSITVEILAYNLFRIAVQQEDEETTRALIDAGVDIDTGVNIDARNGSWLRTTALHQAVINRSSRLVRILLDAGANPNPSYIESLLSLAFECQCGSDLVQMLLDAGANPDPPGDRCSPLQLAVLDQRVDDVRLLLKSKADPNQLMPLCKTSPLQAACLYGDATLVELLLSSGADVDAAHSVHHEKSRNWIPEFKMKVSTSCYEKIREIGETDDGWKNWGIAEFLLGKWAPGKLSLSCGSELDSADCDDKWWHHMTNLSDFIPEFSPLQAAVWRQDLTMVRLILKAETSIDAWPWEGPQYTALQIAACVQNELLVRMLLENGADINHPAGRIYGKTALQAAVNPDNTILLDLLLKLGANVNLPAGAEYGMTALQAAASTGGIESVKLLINSGAAVNASPSPKGGMTALQAAIYREDSDIEVVKILLKAGANVNATSDESRGLTALDAALKFRHTDIAQLLLEEDANISPSALVKAVRKLDIEMVFLLLSNGANPNTSGCEEGLNPLPQAARLGSINLVQVLLKWKADVNMPEYAYGRRTALQAAAEYGSLEVVEVLLQAGADVNAPASMCGRTSTSMCGGIATSMCGKTALQAAAENGSLAIVKVLLQAGADINAPASTCGKTALQAAAENGSLAIVKVLLQAGADINAPASTRGKTALQAAAEKGSLAIVKVLLQAGADVNAPASWYRGETALQTAVSKRHMEIARLLLEHRAVLAIPSHGARSEILSIQYGMEEDGWIEMLMMAGIDINRICAHDHLGKNLPILQSLIWQKSYDLVRRVLALGADTNIRSAITIGPATALQVAVHVGDIDIVQALLDHGADANALASKRHGHTALQGAVSTGNFDILQLLLKNGADINAPPSPESGRTALQQAAIDGNVRITQCLLKLGADVNAPPAREGGVTALQGAAITGNLKIVTMLLLEGADVNGARAEISGRTAIEGAAEHGRLDILHILLNSHPDTEALELEKISAAELATNQGHYAIARFIKAYKR